jgi:hypothetical protein
MYICSELDAKEETDLPQVQHDFGEFHSQLEAYSTAEPARPGLATVCVTENQLARPRQ